MFLSPIWKRAIYIESRTQTQLGYEKGKYTSFSAELPSSSNFPDFLVRLSNFPWYYISLKIRPGLILIFASKAAVELIFRVCLIFLCPEIYICSCTKKLTFVQIQSCRHLEHHPNAPNPDSSWNFSQLHFLQNCWPSLSCPAAEIFWNEHVLSLCPAVLHWQHSYQGF